MQEIDIFSIVRHTSKDDSRSRLLYKGLDSGLLLDGLLLEAQYECSAGYLLMLTEDCPFEEALHIYLLDRSLRPIDKLVLGKAYEPGILKSLKVSGKNSLEFSFFGGDTWWLRVLEKPRYHFSFSVGEWLIFYWPLHRPFRYAFRPNYLRLQGIWL